MQRDEGPFLTKGSPETARVLWRVWRSVAYSWRMRQLLVVGEFEATRRSRNQGGHTMKLRVTLGVLALSGTVLTLPATVQAGTDKHRHHHHAHHHMHHHCFFHWMHPHGHMHHHH